MTENIYATILSGMTISREQCRAARALLDWPQPQLAEAANVSFSTVANFEAGRNVPLPNNMIALQSALEAAGVEFIEAGHGKGAGVRLATG